jgi:PIN domain nuclease of toxin-antitoxin system
VRLLLDTQILYWFFYEPEKLSPKAMQHLTAAEAVLVSSVSVWEIAIKVRIGKMKADPRRMVERFDAAGFGELPIYSRHAAAVSDLPLHHGDPFDRLLIAQAMSEPLHLLTTDAQLKPYSHLVIEV